MGHPVRTYFVYLIWIAREKFPDHTTQGKTQPGAMKKPSPVFNIPFSILPAKTKAFKIITTLKMFRGIYRVFTGKSEYGDFKITGIAGIHAIPIVFHLRYACRYCIKKICIPYMLLAQNLQEIPANFTGIFPQIMLLHGFPMVDT